MIQKDRLGEIRSGKGAFLFLAVSFLALVPMLIENGGVSLSAGTLTAVRLLTFVFLGILVADFAFGLATAGDRRFWLHGHAVETVLLSCLALVYLGKVLFPLGLLAAPGLSGWILPAQIYLLVNLILAILNLFKLVANRRYHYARAFGLSFVAIILLGMLLLWLLPGATVPGKHLGVVDAMFTATSATCVTGLVTVDTGTHFTRFGQIVILVLFQVGGLGLMTFAAFFALAFGKGIGLQDREVMRGVLNLDVAGRISRVIVGILAVTVAFEAIGAILLYGRIEGVDSSHDRLFSSVFHSVSAFCNAGFGLHGDSLVAYASDPVVNFTMMGLIVGGGLGFGVILDLLGVPILGLRSLLGRGKGSDAAVPVERRRLGTQTKIVLISSLVLTLGGAVLFFALEAGNERTLGGLEGAEKVQAALFQSVTARTAGFTTVSIGDLTDGSKFLLLSLMIVGASPGSTGGGIKTVTAVVLLLTVITLFRGRERVEVFKRAIPRATVNKAVVIVVSAVAVLFAGTLVITVVEAGRFQFLSLLFEVGSAFGTVGLSTGITPELSDVSKLVLSAVMLVGRIGPLTLVIGLSQARPMRRYEYPEENVMIG